MSASEFFQNIISIILQLRNKKQKSFLIEMLNLREFSRKYFQFPLIFFSFEQKGFKTSLFAFSQITFLFRSLFLSNLNLVNGL